MPETSTTEIAQRLAFEGPISIWLIVPLGLILFALAIWLGRRDFRHTNRSRWVPVFIALRLGAIVALLWMLAGPTHIQTLTQNVTKSLSIFVDHSASMKLVDPIDESGNNVRWLKERSNETKVLQQIDTELGKIGATGAILRSLVNENLLPSEAEELETRLESIHRSLNQSAEQLRSVANVLPSQLSAQADSLRHVIDQFETNLVTPFDSQLLATEMTQGNKTSLRSLTEHCDSAQRSLAHLADRLAETIESAPTTDLSRSLELASALSRSDKVHQKLNEAESSWLGDLEKKASISRYQFGDSISPYSHSLTNEDPTNNEYSLGTDLSEALQQIALDAADQPLEAAILFTDGGHNSGADPTTIASHLTEVPLFVVPIGNTKMPRDVILHHTLAPRAVYQNDMVVVDSMVTAYRCTGEQLQIELLAGGAVVDQQTITIQREIFDTRLQLKWKASQLGRHEFQVRARPLADEKSDENNQSELSIHVMEDKIRVLIADNLPRWEFRYLVNLFDRDERVEYEQLIFEPRHSNSGRPPQTPTFPFDYDQWMRYRIVILGDLRPAQLTLEHQQLLRRYVTEFGGNLIVIAGRESMPEAFVNQPLESLLPVEPGNRPINRSAGYSLSVTPEGANTMPIQLESTTLGSESLWREMSRRLPIYSLSDYSQLKPTGHSLLAASELERQTRTSSEPLRSFLSWQYVGRGRVVYLAAPISYQLRYRIGDRYHHRFWGQMLRWAIARDLAEGSRTVRLATDKTSYDQGEPIRVSGSLYRLDGSVFSGAAPIVSVSQGDRSIRELELSENSSRPGTYEGTLNRLPTGKVTLSIRGEPIPTLLASEGYDGEIETTISVDPNSALEFRHPLCNMPLLNQIARAGNGIVIPPSGLAAAMQQLDLEPETSETIRRRPIWNEWKYLWIFVGCLSLEWVGRKLLGLV